MYWLEIFLGPGNTDSSSPHPPQGGVCVLLPPQLSFGWPFPPPPPHPEESIHCRLGRYGKSQLCVVGLLRTEKTCRPGRYCIGKQAGFLAVPARPAGPLSSHTDTHTLTQYRSDRQLGQWVRWCVGAVCCDLQLILIVYRLLVLLSLKF